MVDIVTRAGKGSPLTNNEVDANFTNLAEVAGVTGEPMGHEDRTTSTISFNASTRTFTIAPVSGSFTVWCKGKKVVVSSAQTVTIPNTTGMHSIYYDANGTLLSKIGYFSFSTEAPTAYVYWNATTGAAPYFGDERHGVVLDWQTHEYLHRTRGAAIANGFLASGYTLNNSATNAATQIAIESGTFFDEDMKIDIVSTATPTAGTYQQNLLFPAKIPVLHLQGTSWVMDAPTDFPFKQGTSRPQYNSLSGGVWSTADVGNNQHATTWILATNNLTYPVIAIIGQSATDNLGEAEAFAFADLSLTGFPSVEFRPLYKLIYKASDGYANSVNAQLVSIVDLRSISAVGSVANPATDHGNLSGLSDDDHPQYLSVDTVRGALTAAVKASFLPSQTSNAGKFLTTDATSTSWAALTSGNITTALGFTPYNATNPAGYITGITSSNVTTALGFTPYNATNPSGYVTAAGARGAISVTGAGSYDSATGVINIVGGVTSFNTRTGAITLSSADVTTALGFTPYNSTNPNGYLTGITSTQVTTALGYTPYNSSNPSGYITGITSSMVTTALGFTPYSNANPSGYITNSALSGYLTSASAASTYLPLAGGTLTGVLNISNGDSSYVTFGPNTTYSGSLRVGTGPGPLGLVSGRATIYSDNGNLKIDAGTGQTLYLNQHNGGGTVYIGGTTNYILHTGNYNSFALPLSGGTLSGVTNLYAGSSGNSPALCFGTETGGSKKAIYLDTFWLVIQGHQNEGIKLRTTDPSGNTTDRFVVTTSGATINGNQVLHAGNYTSYSPALSGSYANPSWITSLDAGKLTGTLDNARVNGGTYTINITGSAGTATAIGVPTQQAVYTILDGPANGPVIKVRYDGATANRYIDIGSKDGYGNFSSGLKIYNGDTPTWGGNNLLHAGNYSSYALPLSGGTMTGVITTPNGTYGIIIGDDSRLADRNVGNTLFLEGSQNPDRGYLNFSQTSGNSLGAISGGDLTWRGNSVLHAGNYSSYALPLSGGTLTGNLAFPDSLATKIQYNGSNANSYTVGLASALSGGDALMKFVAGATGAGEFGFYTTSNLRLFISSAGSVTSNVDFRTQIFYDSNDTAYYVDPNSSSFLTAVGLGNGGLKMNRQYTSNSIWFNAGTDTNHVLWNGYYGNDPVTRGAVGSGFDGILWNTYAGIQIRGGQGAAYNLITATPESGGGDQNSHVVKLYGYAGLQLATANGYAYASNQFRAPIFYDSNDTAYYVDPAGGNARISRDLYISGNAGGNYGNRLIVGNTSTSYTLEDGNVRPVIQVHGQYPVLSLNHTVTSNGAHGPTVQFTANGTGRQFVIGMNGSGSQLDIGVSNSTQTNWNPHNGIANYEGTTGFRMDTSGNVYNYVSTRSPIFYDNDDTGYYCNPNNVSNFNVRLSTNGYAAYSPDYGYGIQLGAGYAGITPWNFNPGGSSAYRNITFWGTGWNGSAVVSRNILTIGNYGGYVGIRNDSPNYELDVSGIGYSNSSFRAPIFYDSDNTGYYCDPTGTSNFVALSISSGQKITLQDANHYLRYQSTGFSGSTIDGPQLGGHQGGELVTNNGGDNWSLRWNQGGDTFSRSSSRAPIFYDQNDTGYYLDPNSTGVSSFCAGNGRFGWGGGADKGIDINSGSGAGDYGRIRYYEDGTNRQTIHFFSRAWQGGGLTNTSSGAINLDGANGTTFGPWNNPDMWIDHSGHAQSRGSLRAPIFYDSNDTGYYVDPNAGLSINTAGVIRGSYFVASNYASTGYTIYKGYDNYNHFIVVRGYVSGNTSSPSITGGHGTTFVEYAESNDNTGWYFRTAATGNYDLVARITRSYSSFESSVRSTIFYDTNDTGYYCDPNGYSQFSSGNFNSGCSFTGGGQCITAYGQGSVNGSAGIGLNVFSNNGAGAIMAFHRGGYYAVNMGLDSDNVIRIGGWSAAGNRFQFDMGGNFTAAGNVTAYSDERLKKDWASLQSDFIERLATVKSGTYTRIDSEERQAGVSAQDFQKLLPETISADNEGVLSVAYGNAALVSAVELAKEVVDLRKRVAHLESLINKLIGD